MPDLYLHCRLLFVLLCHKGKTLQVCSFLLCQAPVSEKQCDPAAVCETSGTRLTLQETVQISMSLLEKKKKNACLFSCLYLICNF